MPSNVSKRKLRAVISPLQKQEIILYHQKTKDKHESIAKHFSQKFAFEISRRTISKIIEEREKWLRSSKEHESATTKGEMYPDLEKSLLIWINSATASNFILTDEIIRNKAMDIAAQLGTISEEFKFSAGWLTRFKKRNNIKQINLHGEAGSCDQEKIDESRDQLTLALKDFPPDCIYNMDETGLFYKLQPTKTICQAHTKAGIKQPKERITIALCCNMSGSHKLPLMMIGHFKNPRCFKNFRPENFLTYKYNAKAWMTCVIFSEWLEEFDILMGRMNRKAALILDNAPSHRHHLKLRNTVTIFIPPNLTSHLQPLDAGIIQNLKAFYKKTLTLEAIKNFDANKKFSPSLRDAVIWIAMCWNQVTERTIKNCFDHTGICPKLLYQEKEGDNNETIIEDLDEEIQKLGSIMDEDVIGAEKYCNIEDDFSSSTDILSIEQAIQLAKESPVDEDLNYATTGEQADPIRITDLRDSADKILNYFSNCPLVTVEDMNNIFKILQKIKEIEKAGQKQSSILNYIKN